MDEINMNSVVYIIAYVVFAVLGSTLMKFGAGSSVKALFVVPYIDVSVSVYSLLGFISYGMSFLIYTILLAKFDLSFISPVTVGLVYILLMVTAFVFFGESVSAMKITASILIFMGIILMLIASRSA